ncbi:MAG: metallophosphoesterase, partial [Candidatus Aenigmarchaeota archaeon]|nr:metallophosphoesterase [Candidatus Aenigmarchaeota archaeon]
KYKNILIGGFEGSIRYNWNPKSKQYTNFEMKIKIMKMKPSLLKNRLFNGRGIDILVTHAPPFGIHDGKDRCHTGFKPYLKFMEKYKPKYLLHGHVHLYDNNATWQTKYHETTVINAYGNRVIELDL